MTIIEKQGSLSYLKIPSMKVARQYKFPCQYITAVEIVNHNEFYVGNNQFDIQNVLVNGVNLDKTKNQLFIFHKAEIIDIKIKTNEDRSDTYMISLDKSKLVALWHTKRSKLGPLYTLRFNASVIKIVNFPFNKF